METVNTCVGMGEESYTAYQMIFRSYTGSFVYFTVDKASGMSMWKTARGNFLFTIISSGKADFQQHKAAFIPFIRGRKQPCLS